MVEGQKVIQHKTYLGDGLFARTDGDCFILSTEDGIRETNSVVLDIEALNAFLKFIEVVARVKVNIEHIPFVDE